MTNTFNRKAITIGCFGVFLPLLVLTTCVTKGSGITAAAAHVCSGCPWCDPIAAPNPKAIERGCIDHLHRAGHPETQGRFARPSLNQRYSFGYVGGGTAFRGEPRLADEGTWGVDFSGILMKRKIWLQWLHGHREPRVEGSYQPDGPHLLRH